MIFLLFQELFNRFNQSLLIHIFLFISHLKQIYHSRSTITIAAAAESGLEPDNLLRIPFAHKYPCIYFQHAHFLPDIWFPYSQRYL
jgi:hypothetical protein